MPRWRVETAALTRPYTFNLRFTIRLVTHNVLYNLAVPTPIVRTNGISIGHDLSVTLIRVLELVITNLVSPVLGWAAAKKAMYEVHT